MISQVRSSGLIQPFREALQVRHDARRSLKTDKRSGCGGRCHRIGSAIRARWGKSRSRAPWAIGATEEQLSASTQNQSLAALLISCRMVLGGDGGNLVDASRRRLDW